MREGNNWEHRGVSWSLNSLSIGFAYFRADKAMLVHVIVN